jgi:predicted metal-dependent hydrolase
MPTRSDSSRSTAEVEERHVELDHPALPSVRVRVRRNRRTRHVRLHIDEHGEVTASVPARFAASRIDPIVQERAEWLHDVLMRMEMKSRDTQVDLERGDPVRWFGRWIPTELERGGKRAVVRYMVEEDTGREFLHLRVPPGEDEHDALIAWYRREARTVFEERVAWWAAQFGLEYGRVSVREQRTRWGSCTHKGDLNFNWRLVLAPDWVLDSIIVHELCHIEELNHSDAFWALVDARFPRHEEASEWLRDHGAALRVSRPTPSRFAAPPAERMAEATDPAPRRRRRRGSTPSDDQFTLFG